MAQASGSGRGIDVTRVSRDRRINLSERGLEIRHEGRPITYDASAFGFVYLVIDCSASMAGGNKIYQAKKGIIDFAKEARNKGYLTGLIKFESYATHLCEPVRDVSIIEKEVQRIDIGGSTDMAAAIHIATEKLKMKKGSRLIIIATDGMPDSPEETMCEAEQAKKAGIDIITIGTDDADKGFLRKLASRTSLGIRVSREQFGEGISSVATMLPQLGNGKKEG